MDVDQIAFETEEAFAELRMLVENKHEHDFVEVNRDVSEDIVMFECVCGSTGEMSLSELE